MMEITKVKVFPVEDERLKAYVAITFDDCFIVRDMKIINGTNGLFVAMPSKKRKDGAYNDLAHPLNNDTRQWIEKRVFEEYEREVHRKTTGESTTTIDDV
jgi:stage V sporulation protein G